MTLSSAAETGAAPVTIAIDGPAGSGKSSVSKQVARELGYGYLDTGAAYRAFAWHALDRGVDRSARPHRRDQMQRIGQPVELANAILFLASDEASYVNGQAFPVDGGLTASMPYTGKPV